MPPDPHDVGLMRHRLAYQEISATLDELNQPLNSWTTLGTFWAHVQPLVGMELMNARQLKATTGHKILMRNVSDTLPAGVRPQGRFLFEATGRAFGVDQVFRVDERNAYLSIHCTEQVNPQ
jgi:SPP1 family predicted phage head-tail adaptor